MTERKSGLGGYHGSANDRGAADSWYRRPKDPHFYPNGSYNGNRVEAADMTAEEIADYHKGYDENEAADAHKEY